GPQPMVELATRICQSVAGSGSDSLAAVGPQPDRLVERIHSRAAGTAGCRIGVVQPYQSRLPAVEGISLQRSDVGDEPRRRVGFEARRLLFCGVWDPRVG